MSHTRQDIDVAELTKWVANDLLEPFAFLPKPYVVTCSAYGATIAVGSATDVQHWVSFLHPGAQILVEDRPPGIRLTYSDVPDLAHELRIQYAEVVGS